MEKTFSLILALITCLLPVAASHAQVNLVAQPIPDRTVSYSLSESGTSKPILWGLDLAWLSEGNIRRGIAFMGEDRVDLVRSSFTPTSPLVDGELAQEEMNTLNERLRIINTWLGTSNVVLNCDHPSVDPWFKNSDGTVNAVHWAQLMDVTARHHQSAGHTVITASPFNEPDYGWDQGSMSDFYNICGELKTNFPRFGNIRLSGGNTLNADQALPWYDYLKARLDEGNTHQLAGSFDSYSNFYQAVRANNDHGTNDELHNVMEAMVGVEYGMQTGIWWGTAELARGEFVKASDGVRLGYAEHRPNWTAASIYRGVDGKVQAFGGTSERQAVTTTYRFVSRERDVYYDGYGPQREYTLVMPGGTGYQSGQTNAERVVNVTWGEDIQPVINGQYVLVNKSSGKVIEVAGGSVTNGTNLQQGSYTGATHQQWNVTPVDSRIGGDFSYFTMTAVHSGDAADVLNWSLDNGANIITWDDAKGANQQWYLDYKGDGWFAIRSRHSAYCLDIGQDGLSIVQWEEDGGHDQHWRLIPVGSPVEFVAPGAPTNLAVTTQAESVKLTWTASPDSDVAGYSVFRAESSSGPFNMIARNVTATSFVDNSATTSITYYYKVKAVDRSLNRSSYSNQVSAMPTGNNDLVASLQFESNSLDGSVNLNHASPYGSITYVAGKVGSGAIALDGSSDFVQLPVTLANQQSITIATWVYWGGGSAWQRIFDFGNDDLQNMFLTPSSGAGTLRFAIRNGGGEQQLEAPALTTNTWAHVAVTLGASGASMYVNGQLVAQSSSVTLRPSDFNPVLNYIGRSQYPDPLLNARIDDFRVYNYELSPSEIASLSGGTATSLHVHAITTGTASAPKGTKRGTAQVTILNNVGSAVGGATVTGTFSGTFNETVSGVTGSDGKVSLQTTGTAKIVSTVDFCVTNVTHSSLIYNSADNVITCSNESTARIMSTTATDTEVEIDVYPNPAGEVLNIDNNIDGKEVDVQIVDSFGRPILGSRLNGARNVVDIEGLRPGIYLVLVKKDSTIVKIKKLIKE